MIKEKIRTLNELVKIVRRIKKEDKKLVTTNGVFDILHYGHVNYLEKAKQLGDFLIVGVNANYSVKQNKGDKRPINDEKARVALIAALESVDYAFLFGEKDPRKWLSKIKPDIHVKAADYKLSQVIEKKVVEESNGKVVLIPMIKGYSTTNIIKKIRS
jgi:glycerol-3-phosphate cytidylyltransferase